MNRLRCTWVCNNSKQKVELNILQIVSVHILFSLLVGAGTFGQLYASLLGLGPLGSDSPASFFWSICFPSAVTTSESVATVSGLRKDKSALNSFIDACQLVCDFTCPGVSLGGSLNFDKGKDYVSQANVNSWAYKVVKAASTSLGGKILKQPNPQRLCNDDRPFTDEELTSCNLYFLFQIPAEGYMTMPRGASSIEAYPRARSQLVVLNMLHHALCRGADLRHPAVTVKHTNMYLVNEGK